MTGGVPVRARPVEVVDFDELAQRCGLHPDLIRRFVALGLLDEDPPGAFRVEAALRVQRIIRLRQDLGVNYAGIGLVLDLLDRIDALEARLGEIGIRLAE